MTQKSRQHKNQIFFGIVLLVGFTAFMLFGLSFSSSKKGQKDPLIGKSADNFSVSSLRDMSQSFQKEHFQKKNWILNFWASWCESCQMEAQELEQFSKKYPQIPVLGVAIQDEPNRALAFADSLGKSYLLALDDDGKMSINYGVTGVPETFLIDHNGIIKFRHTGPISLDDLESLTKEFFKDVQSQQ